MQHVTAADRVARDHRDHRLRQPADLHLEIEHVEPADAVVVAVAVVAAHALVAARAERLGSLAGEDDHADRRVVAGELERVAELEQRAGPERVAHLGPADRDLGDPVGGVVGDVGEAVGGLRLPLRPGRISVSDLGSGATAASSSQWLVATTVGVFTPTVRLTTACAGTNVRLGESR